MTGTSLTQFLSSCKYDRKTFYEVRRNYVEAISIKYYECVSVFLP
jgi:hypothetical protein